MTGLQNDASPHGTRRSSSYSKVESNTWADKAKLGTTTIATFEPGTAPALGAPAQVANVR